MPDSETPTLFALAVDLAVFTVRGDALQVMLVRREQPPYEGMWALPGGFVQPAEDANLDRAAQRVLWQQTLVYVHTVASADDVHVYLEQLRTYWRQGRDPSSDRQAASVTFLAIAPEWHSVFERFRPEGTVWRTVADVLTERVALAFDHTQIVRRCRSRGAPSP